MGSVRGRAGKVGGACSEWSAPAGSGPAAGRLGPGVPGVESGAGKSGRLSAGVNGVSVGGGLSIWTGSAVEGWTPEAGGPATAAMGAVASLAAAFQMSSGCGPVADKKGKGGKFGTGAKATIAGPGLLNGLDSAKLDAGGLGKAGSGLSSGGTSARGAAGGSAGEVSGGAWKGWNRFAKAPLDRSSSPVNAASGVPSGVGSGSTVPVAGAAVPGNAGTSSGSGLASLEKCWGISMGSLNHGTSGPEGRSTAQRGLGPGPGFGSNTSFSSGGRAGGGAAAQAVGVGNRGVLKASGSSGALGRSGAVRKAEGAAVAAMDDFAARAARLADNSSPGLMGEVDSAARGEDSTGRTSGLVIPGGSTMSVASRDPSSSGASPTDDPSGAVSGASAGGQRGTSGPDAATSDDPPSAGAAGGVEVGRAAAVRRRAATAVPPARRPAPRPKRSLPSKSPAAPAMAASRAARSDIFGSGGFLSEEGADSDIKRKFRCEIKTGRAVCITPPAVTI